MARKPRLRCKPTCYGDFEWVCQRVADGQGTCGNPHTVLGWIGRRASGVGRTRRHIQAGRLLALPHQAGDVDQGLALEVPNAQREAADALGPHAWQAELMAQSRRTDAGMATKFRLRLTQCFHQPEGHLRTGLGPVVADFVPAVFPGLWPQEAGLHGLSPRAMARSSSMSACTSGVPGPLARPSSTKARKRWTRCSRGSLRISSRTYSLVLPYSPDSTRCAT